MSRLTIRHSTGYRYAGEIAASYNEARMLPSQSSNQFVLHSQLQIEPVSSQHRYQDYWGTAVSSFEVLTPHRELMLTATSTVELRESTAPERVMGWDALRTERLRAVGYVEAVGQTPLTAPPADLARLATELAAGASDVTAAAREICLTVGDRMHYVQGVTGVQSTAQESWADKRGVCQDIAHIALGALRAAGIPARYVSGYLHPNTDAVIGETVAGESHAWVEWFCGEWRGFDPTNSIDIGTRHVAVGRGRDYNDVAPLRGVYSGAFGSQLFVTVEIRRDA